jgi:hypothetical protein
MSKDPAAVSLGRRGGLARTEAQRVAHVAALVKAREAKRRKRALVILGLLTPPKEAP